MENHFEILVHGHLPPEWTAIFEGMNLVCTPDGNTLITACLPDQAALYGLVENLRIYGLTLISINPDAAEHSSE